MFYIIPMILCFLSGSWVYTYNSIKELIYVTDRSHTWALFKHTISTRWNNTQTHKYSLLTQYHVGDPLIMAVVFLYQRAIVFSSTLLVLDISTPIRFMFSDSVGKFNPHPICRNGLVFFDSVGKFKPHQIYCTCRNGLVYSLMVSEISNPIRFTVEMHDFVCSLIVSEISNPIRFTAEMRGFVCSLMVSEISTPIRFTAEMHGLVCSLMVSEISKPINFELFLGMFHILKLIMPEM